MSNAPPDDGTARLADVREALHDVRRENRKAVLLSALVDVALVALVVNLALSWFWPALPAVPHRAVVAVAVGVGVGGLVAGWWLGRQSAVRRFERANPSVGVALRTARDAAADAEEDPMARALYDETLARLRESSGVALVARRRLAATIVLVFLVAILTVQVTVAPVSVGGVQIGPGGSSPDLAPGAQGGGQGPEQGGSPADGTGQDGNGEAGSGTASRDDVLGDPVDVPRGSVEQTAQVDVGSGTDGAGVPYDRAGLDGDRNAVAPQEAEFAPPEDLSDADIIRAYNLRIRDDEEDDQ